MRGMLFTPCKIGSVVVKNRFIRSATFESLGDENGFPKQKLLSMMKSLADGEVGLIIPGSVYPSLIAKAPTEVGLMNEKQANAWKSTIDYIHSKHSKLFFQICHSGSFSNERKGVSGLIQGSTEMSNADIEEMISSFVSCAKWAKVAGADGVQLHAAHGVLLAEFLSPAFNRRNDKWGKDPTRVIREIATEIKKACDLPVSIKMNGHDCIDGSVTPKIAGLYVKNLMDVVDMFEISCGLANFAASIRKKERNPNPNNKYPYKEGYNVEFAKEIRKIAPKAKIAVVGGLRNFEYMDKLIVDRTADFVSMSRPFIQQPHIIRNYQDALTTRCNCISCNECMENVNPDIGIICSHLYK